jgi:hypothetical protein
MTTIDTLNAAFLLACEIADQANAEYDAYFPYLPAGEITFEVWMDTHKNEPTIPQVLKDKREAAIALRDIARRALNEARDTN